MQVQYTRLTEDAAYGAAYGTIKNRLAEKGKRPSGGEDPQNNTTEDTLTVSQYLRLMKHLLSSDRAVCLRDKSIFAYLYASVGRADEGRMIFLADIMSPRLLQCVGE